MRKVIFLIHVSLDGFVAGPNGEMDWIVNNDDLQNYIFALHNTTDAAIYGRVTYQMMEAYWPSVLADPKSSGVDLDHARWQDKATKIVFSRTLKNVQWKNSLLIPDNIAHEMEKIKSQPGKNLWLLGSPSIAQEFMRLGLIDEYWLNISPVLLGSGMPLFGKLDQPVSLNLLQGQTFKGGVIALRYEPHWMPCRHQRKHAGYTSCVRRTTPKGRHTKIRMSSLRDLKTFASHSRILSSVSTRSATPYRAEPQSTRRLQD